MINIIFAFLILFLSEINPSFCMDSKNAINHNSITLISSDKKIFEINKSNLFYSHVLKELLEDHESQTPIILPLVHSTVLGKLVTILKSFSKIAKAHIMMNSFNDFNIRNKLQQKHIEKNINTIAYDIFKHYSFSDKKDLIIAANYLDVPLITNLFALGIGIALFTDDWNLPDYSFDSLPKKLKDHILNYTIENIYNFCTQQSDSCEKLCRGLIAHRLSFEQCLTCIQLIKNKPLNFSLLKEEFKVPSQVTNNLFVYHTESSFMGSCLIPVTNFWINKILYEKREALQNYDIVNLIKSSYLSDDVNIVKHVIEYIKHKVYEPSKYFKHDDTVINSVLRVAIMKKDVDLVKLIMYEYKSLGILKELLLEYSDQNREINCSIFIFLIRTLPNVELLKLFIQELKNFSLLKAHLVHRSYFGTALEVALAVGTPEVIQCIVKELSILGVFEEQLENILLLKDFSSREELKSYLINL